MSQPYLHQQQRVSMRERRVTFYTQSLGIKLHRGDDGKVRVIDVKSNHSDHAGDIYVGDVLCEITGIVDLRNKPISNQMWGDVIRAIKMEPRPLVLVMGDNDNLSRQNAGGSGDVGDECAFDPFGVHHTENENVDGNQIRHRRVLTSSSKQSGMCTKGSKSSNSFRRTRSLTPPTKFIPSLFGRKESKANNTNSMKNSTNGGSTQKNSAQSVAKNLQKATACLIPQERRDLSGGGGDRGQLPEYDTRGLNDRVNSSSWETEIECKDFQQMLLVSNISLDDDLLEFQGEENARYDNCGYPQGAASRQRYYQEEIKEDPPSHQPYVTTRRKTTIRRTSF